ncbi:MAG: hypothetical protein ACR2KC_06195 [Acidimicrobiales bacterium]
MAGSPVKLTNPAGLIRAHRLDLTANQQPSHACLAGIAAPGVGDHGGRDDGDGRFGHEADVLCPHAPIVSLSCDEGPRVVGDPSHHAERFDGERPSSSRAWAKPSATSLLSQRPVFGLPLRGASTSRL